MTRQREIERGHSSLPSSFLWSVALTGVPFLLILYCPPPPPNECLVLSVPLTQYTCHRGQQQDSFNLSHFYLPDTRNCHQTQTFTIFILILIVTTHSFILQSLMAVCFSSNPASYWRAWKYIPPPQKKRDSRAGKGKVQTSPPRVIPTPHTPDFGMDPHGLRFSV